MSKQDLDSHEDAQDSGEKDSQKKNSGKIEPLAGSLPFPSETIPSSPGVANRELNAADASEEPAVHDQQVLSAKDIEEDPVAAGEPDDISPATEGEQQTSREDVSEPAGPGNFGPADENERADLPLEIHDSPAFQPTSEEESVSPHAEEASPAGTNEMQSGIEQSEDSQAPDGTVASGIEPTEEAVVNLSSHVIPAVPPSASDESGISDETPAAPAGPSSTEAESAAIQDEGVGDSIPATVEDAGEVAADVASPGAPLFAPGGAIGLIPEDVPSIEAGSAEGPTGHDESGGDEAQEIPSESEQTESDAEPAGRLPSWDAVPAAKSESGFGTEEEDEDEMPPDDDLGIPVNDRDEVIEGGSSASPAESVSDEEGADVSQESAEAVPAAEPTGSALNGLEEIVEGGNEEAEVREDVVDDLAHIIESIVFASDEPLSVATIKSVLDAAHTFGRMNPDMITSRISALNSKYEADGSGFYIVEIANGYQYATRKEHAQWVSYLFKERSKRKLSNSALETVAIIAYKQPITKPEIESIRGVNVDYVLHNLLEKELITVVGRAETVGRPLLYGTTQKFLKIFALKSLDDLPKLREIEEIIKEIKSKGAEESIQLEITALGDSSAPEQTTEPESKPEMTTENGTE